MRVNLSIFSMIVVDCWCIKVGILRDRCDEGEEDFYEALAGEMIDNNMDTYGTRNTSTANVQAPATFVEADGHVASGIGIHLTPTKKRRKQKGEVTKYLQQDWCPECRKFKSTYVCSVCRKTVCHTKTGRLCFSQHVEKYHPVD